ncbi:MAG: nucleotide exchange factor GrpE [Moorea sp. SIO2B7]|nr:nucleotide exchange factor GrpE [Moorena sp. SIO2B7]
MINDQKQPETTSEHPDKTSELSEEIEAETNPNQVETSSVETDSEAPSQETTTTSEVLPEETSSSGENLASEAQSAPELDSAKNLGAELKSEIESLQQQLEQQKGQTESFRGQYVRLAADFDNFRKRVVKEKEDLENQVKRNTINELLSAIDSFERARAQIKPNNDGEKAIHKSYQGVYKQLVDGLKRIGVSAMRPEGEEFDPNFHEAVFREPTDEYQEGVVIEQVMRGYLLDERVLRHAMVKVAAAKEPGVSSEETSQPEVETETEET